MTDLVPTTFRYIDPIALKRTIVVRWTGPLLPSDVATYILQQGYKLAKDNENLAPIGWYIDDDKVIVLELESIDYANRIEEQTAVNDYMIGQTRLKVRKLIGPDGIRIRDSIDLLKCNQHNMNDIDVLNFMTEVLAVYEKGKDELAKSCIDVVKNLLEIMFYKAKAHVFGSYSTPLRRQGSSDIDVTFWYPNATVEDANDPTLKVVWTENELQAEIQKMAKDPRYYGKPLTRIEIDSIPRETIFKMLFQVFSRFPTFADHFLVFYFTKAKVPMMVFKHKEAPYVKIDVSLNNRIGYDKAQILELFMKRDASEGEKMRKCMIFIVHWARCNKLIGGIYPDEELARGGFNSYIFNHLVIHFLQFFSKTQIFQMNTNPELRVSNYNFDSYFSSIAVFFREFFKHLASIDFSMKAIYNDKVMNKYLMEQCPSLLPFINCRETVVNCHGMSSAPLVVMDPMDPGHNIAKRVTADDMKRLNQLIRNTLLILKQRSMNIATLLETNKNATIIMSSISWSFKNIGPNTLSFELPEIIQTSAEFCVLLNKILRFDVSSEHEGTSSANLLGETGVTFFVYGRAWIGRRNLRRKMKNLRKDESNLKIEVEVSRSFEFTYEEPVAVVKVFMTEIESEPSRTGKVQVIQGLVSDMHDAFHYLIDQFLVNNLQDLAEFGIMQLAEL